MTNFKIATWNVNSLRVRLPHVQQWLKQVQPDVLAIQEIKMVTEDFPFAVFAEEGYKAVACGQKTYNGVAIISRLPSENMVTAIPDWNDIQCRVLGVTIGDIRILNLYVPNGQSVGSEKYQYKLAWLEKLDAWLKKELAIHPKVIILGDFNIAPEEIDVHDPILWQGQVLFSDLERQAFKDMLQVGFKDCFRQLAPEEQAYSWWDYRLNAFKRKMGLRIDHILASNALAPFCAQCYIDAAPRSWDRPSDHAPIVAEFNLSAK